MFPLYEIAIEPVLRAIDARRVVEIGALQGQTTEKLLDLLGDEAELHVIDPVPQFDPSEHQQRFPGRYHFHRDTSHNVLPALGPVDAALIDGDHNWYTVYNELKLLAASADEAGAPLPLLILHDVGWPYGRRDLYYAPERIPEEYRQPYAQKGLMLGRPDVCDSGGLSPQFNNALREGGPRNGVMTALEDFVAGREGSLRTVIVPVHFGLAIVAGEDRLASQPQLTETLDRLESAEGRREQAELGESLRVRRLAEGKTGDRSNRAASRYLDVVKAALLDEHYLENEVRLDYLYDCVEKGRRPDPLILRDPNRELRRDVMSLRQARQTGAALGAIAKRPLYPFTTVGRSGLDRLEASLKTIRDESISGDLLACGIWRGGAAIFLRAFLEAHDMDQQVVWVADTFSGPSDSDAAADDSEGTVEQLPNLVADVNLVREGFSRFGLLDDRVRFLQGPLAHSLADAPIGELAMLHLGHAQRAPTATALERLYDSLSHGGIVLIEHYDAPGCRRAVDEFRADRGIDAPLRRIDWRGALWRKPASAPALTELPALRGGQLDRPPVIGPAADPGPALSVVVVFHNMRREAARTLHSLSRSYQQGVEDLDYEVIVVENGSSEEEKLGEQFVGSFGPHFRYLDLAEKSTPSPAHALNQGLAVARGETIGLMIDGAHVLSPGVLRYAMLGLRTYAPAIVTTHQWFLGPGQQSEAMEGGYDRDYEDRLFGRIGWPVDGYRLFEIGTFIGDRDWFDGLWESNCLFTPRALLTQVGGLDETFSMPGGGYANLDLFERLGATPGLNVVGMLGEASFHQLHDGTTTNQPDVGLRHGRLMEYRDHYETVRNRAFRGPNKPRHFVGKLAGPALRTRPRWNVAAAFKRAQRLKDDGFPEHPTPVPEQLQDQFTDAFWRGLQWRDTRWLGQRVERSPTDLVAYQELVDRVRPEWIVAPRQSGAAGAMFLASICELVGSGKVICVQSEADEGERPEHPRIGYVTGGDARETRGRVFEAVGNGAEALLVIPPGPRMDVVADFKAYEPLVPPGSYAIIEGTVLNGHPVHPGYGEGPAEAVQMILKTYSDFLPDHHPERFGMTFNPRGFLRRTE